MCKKKRYQEVLYEANIRVGELRSITFLFYPENGLLDKYKRFQKDQFLTACDNAIAALEKLDRLNTKRTYSDEHLCEQLLSDIDKKWYYTYGTQAILGCVKRKTERLTSYADSVNKEDSCYPVIAGHFLAFLDILIDVGTFLIRFAKWKGIDTTTWATAGMRKRVSAREVFACSMSIMNRQAYLNDLSVPPLSVFMLRQAIELKISEILNIYCLVDGNGNLVKITSDKFLPILSDDHFILPLRKSTIEKIHQWTNGYIHMGVFDTFWKIEFAQFVISKFCVMRVGFALKSYYENDMERDVLQIARGASEIVHLHDTPLNMEFLNEDTFRKVQIGVQKEGYDKFIEEQDAKKLEELKKWAQQN